MLTRWLVLALVAASCRIAAACSCSLEHPQTHFCNSDFVIVGRVQKTFRGKDFYDAYKVKIRNTFKATPKARVALASGRILTPSQESLCGVTLQPRETYVITGKIVHLEAHVSLCSYVTKWREVTPRQRKGFRLLYKQGCTCKVHVTRRRTKSPNTCVTNNDECFERHGICMHDRERRCRWTRGQESPDRTWHKGCPSPYNVAMPRHGCYGYRFIKFNQEAPALTRCLQSHNFNSTMT